MHPTRRHFLRTSTAALAVLGSAPLALGAGKTKKLRIVQIGCGGRGSAHHGM